MQEENETFRDFLDRTDKLAAQLGINVEDLPKKLGISRATLFFCRAGTRAVSAKTLNKLRLAEQEVENETRRKSQHHVNETQKLMEDEVPYGASPEPTMKDVLKALASALDLLNILIEREGQK